MIPILKPKEMYSLDSHLINNLGIESKLLMENAAVYTSIKIRKIVALKSRVLILCGVGNNGGDGLALVRHLIKDYEVSYYLIGDITKQSSDNKYNYDILQGLKIYELKQDEFHLDDYDCIIDSIYGIGGKLLLSNEISVLINNINLANCLRIAIDIPTGLNCESGIANEFTFKADYTFTMYAEKTGLLLNDGKDYSGKIVVLDLGIPQSIIKSFTNIYKYCNEAKTMRINNTSKFQYGMCLVIAGSKYMPGAAALTCNAAISAGAGLVYLLTTSKQQNLYLEIINYEVSDYNVTIFNNNEINLLLEKSNSIVIGPGLGRSSDITFMINTLLELYPNKRFIIDADGISALDSNKSYNHNITITPHLGEFANLISMDKSDIIENIVEIVKETALKMNLNILLKGPSSIISNGEEVYFVSDGMPEMATAGSGDVLSGILGAQVNHNLNTNFLHSISNATLTHINAAKHSLKNSNTLIASDIIKGLKCIK